jgi:hypothetical protein
VGIVLVSLSLRSAVESDDRPEPFQICFKRVTAFVPRRARQMERTGPWIRGIEAMLLDWQAPEHRPDGFRMLAPWAGDFYTREAERAVANGVGPQLPERGGAAQHAPILRPL